MRERGNVVWLSKGVKIEEPDTNTTAMLLELGALDSVWIISPMDICGAS